MATQPDPMAEAVDALRTLLLVAHSFRQDLAAALTIAVSDTFALSHLAVAGDLSAGELAHRAGLAPSSMTALLDRLERAGLARRTARPGDRRAQLITLTDRGRAVLTVSGQWMQAGFDAIPAGQLAAITGQLRMLATALDAGVDSVLAGSSIGDRLDAETG